MAGELGVEQAVQPTGTEGATPTPDTATQATSSQPAAPTTAAGASPAPAAASPNDIAAQALAGAPANQPAAGAAQLPPDVQQRLQRLDEMERQLQQLQPYAQLGYQAHQRQQQERQQQLQREQQEQAARPWFTLPDFDPALLKFVERDPATGQLRAREGAPPDTLARYTQFSDSLSDLQMKFWRNPGELLGEPVKRIATEVAQQLIQQHFGGYRDEVTANQIVGEHAGWIFGTDATGRRAFTPEGKAYMGYVEQAKQYGIAGAQRQHDYALGLVQRDLLWARHQQGQQAGAAEAGKQQFVANAAAGAAGAGPATGGQPAASLSNGGAAAGANGSQLSLRDLALRNLRKAGLVDTVHSGAA